MSAPRPMGGRGRGRAAAPRPTTGVRPADRDARPDRRRVDVSAPRPTGGRGRRAARPDRRRVDVSAPQRSDRRRVDVSAPRPTGGRGRGRAAGAPLLVDGDGFVFIGGCHTRSALTQP
ncbi:hypothetical protein [Roseiflexus sp.]|uniref:hypothetical protein n=1 Tax=Roseiflexus sp. TaxID=2562120 RepID=UPI0025899DEC|nr:hypothetical protein [Roseiflexus sp.]